MAKLNFPLCLTVLGSWYIMCMSSNLEYVSAQDDIGPDAEESEIFENFLTELEQYSGLSPLNETERLVVEHVNCSTSKCIINVNGDIVWDIRMQLYTKFMSFTKESDEGIVYTLDGCLDTTTTNDTYNTCMKKVRTDMLNFLQTYFKNTFKTLLERQCEINENCIIEQDSIRLGVHGR